MNPPVPPARLRRMGVWRNGRLGSGYGRVRGEWSWLLVRFLGLVLAVGQVIGTGLGGWFCSSIHIPGTRIQSSSQDQAPASNQQPGPVPRLPLPAARLLVYQNKGLDIITS